VADHNATSTEPETVTVQALVTLTVAPKVGQTPEAAAAEMLLLFTEYLTVPDNTFLTDYGASAQELEKFRAGEHDEEPTWGGYDGPFVLEANVAAVAELE
jgi:hypothetical protein